MPSRPVTSMWGCQSAIANSPSSHLYLQWYEWPSESSESISTAKWFCISAISLRRPHMPLRYIRIIDTAYIKIKHTSYRHVISLEPWIALRRHTFSHSYRWEGRQWIAAKITAQTLFPVVSAADDARIAILSGDIFARAERHFRGHSFIPDRDTSAAGSI